MNSIKNSEQEHGKSGSKKPFNKKKWREQKYSAKAKVSKWEHAKKRQALRQFNKELKNSGINFRPKGNNKYSGNNKDGSFQEAQSQYYKMQQEKADRLKEQERIKRERSEALKAYKEKKAIKNMKLSQKTKKGQPLMRGRIELLLEKIQRDYVNCNR